MSLSTWLARLAGARAEILSKAPGDVNKHAALGGVLLTTSGVAAVSAFFALHSVLELPPAVAAAVGAAWGLIIFNLDRMLVVTMTRDNGWLLNLLAALPRLALALVIGTIISMPLVLKIFEPEINSELIAMQAETVKRNQDEYDKAYAKIKELEQEEAGLLAVLAGRAATSVSDDPDVKAAKSALEVAEKAYQDARQSAQCEFDGTCGTGVPGDGESYRQKKKVADDAEAARDRAQSTLDDVTAKVTKRVENGSATDTENAKKRLPEVQADLDRLRGDREGLERRGSDATAADTGLLARLEALDRITDDRPSGGQAHLAVFLLFLSIEVLPVLLKLLSGFAPETLYDRLAKRVDDGADSDDELWAKRDRDLAVDRADQNLAMERHKLDAQTKAHAKTTQLVADKQLGMAVKAIDVWAALAQLRTDEELHLWYRANLGADHQHTMPIPKLDNQRTMPIPRTALPTNGTHVPGVPSPSNNP
jgi:hypothetical protein